MFPRVSLRKPLDIAGVRFLLELYVVPTETDLQMWTKCRAMALTSFFYHFRCLVMPFCECPCKKEI